MAFGSGPVVRTGLPSVFKGHHMVDLHFGAGGAATYKMDGLSGVRIGQCAGLDHTGTGVFVGDVREITGEHVVAYVAAIAVDVGGTETEGIAVVAGGALVVVYGERVQSVGG